MLILTAIVFREIVLFYLVLDTRASQNEEEKQIFRLIHDPFVNGKRD